MSLSEFVEDKLMFFGVIGRSEVIVMIPRYKVFFLSEKLNKLKYY